MQTSNTDVIPIASVTVTSAVVGVSMSSGFPIMVIAPFSETETVTFGLSDTTL